MGTRPKAQRPAPEPVGVVRTSRERSQPARVSHGAREVVARCFADADHPPAAQRLRVVEEHALRINVADVASFTLMWTRTDAPGAAGYLACDGVLADSDALALAAGFLFAEGLIDGIDDVAEMATCPDTPDVLRVRLACEERARMRPRNSVIASACGMCGDGVPVSSEARVQDRLRLRLRDVQRMIAAMESRQYLFNTTGGAHAASLFDASCRVLATAEDLGRHNALDKVIGRCLLERVGTAGCGAVLSGRASLEMIVKAARAGLELVAAVSAPTTLAIDTAERAGITLCGFVRNDRLTAFTHPHRLG